MQLLCKYLLSVLLVLVMYAPVICTVQKKSSAIKGGSKPVAQASQQPPLLRAQPTFKIPAAKKDNPHVRVLLATLKPHQRCVLSSQHGFWYGSHMRVTGALAGELIVTHHKQAIIVNGKPYYEDALALWPQRMQLGTALDGKVYEGSFELVRDHDKLLVINSVPLEEYVCSVLRTESWPGWPLEVNKAFAIASRTYAIAMLMRARKTKKRYHVKNTNAHQTYQGIHTCDTIKKAVEQTRGVFLAYEGKPIIAMFDACCGGVVPAHIADFDFKDAPYLARPYACKHCKKCKIYSWQAEYEPLALGNLLLDVPNSTRAIRDIKITKRDKAGVVQEVEIKDGKSTTRISGQQLYSLIKEVKSFCFDVHKKSGKFHLSGRGYGHHVGICQWGAREMVRDGWNYKRVLEFYYPGTQFMTLALDKQLARS